MSDYDFITMYVCDKCWWEGLPEVSADDRWPRCGNCGSTQLRREQRDVPMADMRILTNCSWSTFNLKTETCHRCSLTEGHEGDHDYSVLVPGMPKPSIAAFVNHSKLVSEEDYQAALARFGH